MNRVAMLFKKVTCALETHIMTRYIWGTIDLVKMGMVEMAVAHRDTLEFLAMIVR
jgi:hypothetical protein